MDSMVGLDGDLKSGREAERKGAWGMQPWRANTAYSTSLYPFAFLHFLVAFMASIMALIYYILTYAYL